MSVAFTLSIVFHCSSVGYNWWSENSSIGRTNFFNRRDALRGFRHHRCNPRAFGSYTLFHAPLFLHWAPSYEALEWIYSYLDIHPPIMCIVFAPLWSRELCACHQATQLTLFCSSKYGWLPPSFLHMSSRVWSDSREHAIRRTSSAYTFAVLLDTRAFTSAIRLASSSIKIELIGNFWHSSHAPLLCLLQQKLIQYSVLSKLRSTVLWVKNTVLTVG